MQALEIGTKKLECPHCKEKCVSILGSHAYAYSCSKCLHICETYSGTIKLTNQKFNKLKQESGYLKIRSVGKLNDISYTVCAVAVRKEAGTSFLWEEYLLFNQAEGFAFLSQYQGSWILFKETLNYPALGIVNRTTANGIDQFRIYAKYKAILIYAIGEWPFPLLTDEKYEVYEYVKEDEMFVCEFTKDYKIWYKGTHIDANTLQKEFAVAKMPAQTGISPIQPIGGNFSYDGVKKMTIIIALLWGMLQFFFMSTSKDQLVFHAAYSIVDSTNKKEIYTPAFELKGDGTKNVEIKVSTDIKNSWFYTGVTLVNETTGDLYDAEMEAEYYYGYTEGEHWSEGSEWTSRVISQVPEGKYYMILYPVKPEGVTTAFEIDVYRDVFIFSNGLLVLFILLLFPAYFKFKVHSFEKKKWNNSNYSPYD